MMHLIIPFLLLLLIPCALRYKDSIRTVLERGWFMDPLSMHIETSRIEKTLIEVVKVLVHYNIPNTKLTVSKNSYQQ